jgi:hypothetical protein
LFFGAFKHSSGKSSPDADVKEKEQRGKVKKEA